MRPLRFQEFIDVVLKRLDWRSGGHGKQLYSHGLTPTGPSPFSQQKTRPPSLNSTSKFQHRITERFHPSRVLGAYAAEDCFPMKLFRCQVCDNIIYFENRSCGRCGHRLGYVPELEIMAALEPAGRGSLGPLGGEGGAR